MGLKGRGGYRVILNFNIIKKLNQFKLCSSTKLLFPNRVSLSNCFIELAKASVFNVLLFDIIYKLSNYLYNDMKNSRLYNLEFSNVS